MALTKVSFSMIEGQLASVTDLGAVGNGVADDTAAIQAALDTGNNPYFEANKVYKISGPLTPTVDGQILDLNGSTLLLYGNTAGITVTNSLQNVTICNGTFDCPNMTGGYVITVSTADRTTLDNLRCYDPYNFLYVEEANVVSVQNVWVNNVRGAYGIHWYGDVDKRSDILRLIGVNLSSDQNAVGIMWDGNCNTLQAQAVTIVKPTIGVHVRNTSGGPVPLFGFFDDIEIDFPSGDGVRLDVGEDFYFTPLFYSHDSASGSGIYVGAAVPDDRVVVTGGKITDHTRYGIENYSRVMLSNPVIFDNALGNYYNTDEIYMRSPRMEVDGTGYFGLNGGNPIVNWDETDTDGYLRSTNVRYMNVGGTARFRASDNANAIEIYVGGALKRIEVGAADSGGTGYRMLRVTN